MVKDTSPLLVQSFANIYTVYAPEEQDNLWIDGYGGDTQVILLLKAPGVSDEHIRNQVKSRYATFASVLKKEGKQVDYHPERPIRRRLSISNSAQTPIPIPTHPGN